jgi:hypothetical protein
MSSASSNLLHVDLAGLMHLCKNVQELKNIAGLKQPGVCISSRNQDLISVFRDDLGSFTCCVGQPPWPQHDIVGSAASLYQVVVVYQGFELNDERVSCVTFEQPIQHTT